MNRALAPRALKSYLAVYTGTRGHTDMATTPKLRTRCCRECSTRLDSGVRPGSNVATHTKVTAIFCSDKCRADWNNRRKNRGADLYDLWMAQRYSRNEAEAAGVWAEMCRLSEQWNTEDKAAGHKTYSSPAEVIARLKDRGAIRRGPMGRV